MLFPASPPCWVWMRTLGPSGPAEEFHLPGWIKAEGRQEPQVYPNYVNFPTRAEGFKARIPLKLPERWGAEKYVRRVQTALTGLNITETAQKRIQTALAGPSFPEGHGLVLGLNSWTLNRRRFQ